MKFSTTLFGLSVAFGLATAFPVKTHVNGTTTADLHNTTAVEGCIDYECPGDPLYTWCASTVNLDPRAPATNVSAPAPFSPRWNLPSTWFMERDPCCSFFSCHRSKECMDFTDCYRAGGSWVCPATSNVEARDVAVEVSNGADATAIGQGNWEYWCYVWWEPICGTHPGA
jgi:hypothetical protein